MNAQAKALFDRAQEAYTKGLALQADLQAPTLDEARRSELTTQLDGFWDDAQRYASQAETLVAQETKGADLAARLSAPDTTARLAQAAGTIQLPQTPDVDDVSGDAYALLLKRMVAAPQSDADRARRAAFSQALQKKMHELSDTEVKSLNATTASEGGYLVAPQQFVAQLLQKVDDYTYARALCHVEPMTAAQSLGVPTVEAQIDDADWTPEVTTAALDAGLQFGKRELKPSQLTKRVRASKRLLRLSAIPVEQTIRDRLAYKFAISLEKAWMTGTGAGKPLGVFTASANGISTARDITTASATAIVATELMDTMYSLKQAYWDRATWIMNRNIFKDIRKLLDLNGQPIWQIAGPGAYGAGVTTGAAPTLLDRPYKISEYAPGGAGTNGAPTASTYSLIIGDFSQYWWAIVLDLEVQVLLELYAETGENGYIGRLEADGMPIFEEAFARLIQHS